jgi:6-pyruvoyl-tetrahydropterin synthase
MKKDVFDLFIKDLTVLDCAVYDPQRGPIGMSWNIGIQFIGNLNEEGVVFDFSYAKKTAKKLIDSTADHAFIAPKDLIECTKKNEKDYFKFSDGIIEYEAPIEAFFLVDHISDSFIFAKLEKLILEECKKNKDCAELQTVKLTYTKEDEPGCSYYHYTHGLKTHYGHCARLIHGHRSLVEIYINDKRNESVEEYVKNMYFDKHLVFKENIIAEDEYTFTIGYKTQCQGEFTLKIPKKDCVIYKVETTVENISKEIFESILPLVSGTTGNKTNIVKVVAYEGIGKGSVYIGKTKPILKALFDSLGFKG